MSIQLHPVSLRFSKDLSTKVYMRAGETLTKEQVHKLYAYATTEKQEREK